MRLCLSTTYHPQTNGQSERIIQTQEDMLRACVLDNRGSWDRYLPLVEFAYNNSHHASIGMAPYEALYGRKYQSPLCWFELGEQSLLGPDLVKQTTEQIRRITVRSLWLKAAKRVIQIKGENLEGQKLSPHFLGLFQILKCVGSIAYQMALPPNLSNLYNIFHVSQSRKYTFNPSHLLESKSVQLRDDLTFNLLPSRIMDGGVK